MLQAAPIEETVAPVLPTPTAGQTIAADYRSLGLTLHAHPLALLRAQLAARRFETAAALQNASSKLIARACGIVTVRQRPPTSKGVIFITLEDETGWVNVVVRPQLIERQRREVVGAALLGVYGAWQSREGVKHLLAQRLIDLTPLLGALTPKSRDFF